MAHTAARASSTILPPEGLEPLLDLSRFLEHVSAPSVLVGPDGQTVGLPEEVYEVLIKVVDAMSHGRAITVAAVDQMLTTQEAADHLGISRPTPRQAPGDWTHSLRAPSSGTPPPGTPRRARGVPEDLRPGAQ